MANTKIVSNNKTQGNNTSTTLENKSANNPLDTSSCVNIAKELKKIEKIEAEVNALNKEQEELLKDLNSVLNNPNHKIDNKEISQNKDGKFTILKKSVNSKINNLYINGMMTTYDEALETAHKLLDSKAGNAALLYNGTTKNVINDGTRVLAGRISDNLGNHCEKSVNSLINYLKEKLESGEQINLYAHSQGAVIIQNALGLLKGELTESDFEKLRTKTTINLFGAASYNMSGIKTVAYENKNDLVPKILGAGKDENVIKVENQDGGHKIKGYVENL